MRELWWKIAGTLRVELTGADVERTLRELAKRYRMEDIRFLSPLVVRFTLPRAAWSGAKAVSKRNGDGLRVLDKAGWRVLARNWLDAPVIVGTVALLLAASVWLPSRILFIRVEGNETIPAGLILEQAEQAGLCFGTSRAGLRSEQLKNRLLEAMPSLSWVGVNTSGCVATITVRERTVQPEREELLPGNIISVTDAVIQELTVTTGTALVHPGDAVREGQVLISGYTDLGLCTHVEAAVGEVYGLTRRECEAMLPEKAIYAEEERTVVKKFSLLIGKNRINFTSGSGILYIGCGKMTRIRVLRLPGGWELPVALVVEEYTMRDLTEEKRPENEARALMEQSCAAQTRAQMIAGQILDTEWMFHSGEGVYRLTGKLDCREMIGRRSSGILTEGDANDRKNGERGAG